MKLTIEVTETQRDQILKDYLQKWELKDKDEYWYIDSYGSTVSDCWWDETGDRWRRFTGNCFETREEAEKRKAYLVALHTVRNAIEPGNSVLSYKDTNGAFDVWVPSPNRHKHVYALLLPLMSNAQHIINTYQAELRIIFGVEK